MTLPSNHKSDKERKQRSSFVETHWPRSGRGQSSKKCLECSFTACFIRLLINPNAFTPRQMTCWRLLLRPMCCSLRWQKKTLSIGQDVTVCSAAWVQEMNLSLRKSWKHGSASECVRVCTAKDKRWGEVGRDFQIPGTFEMNNEIPGRAAGKVSDLRGGALWVCGPLVLCDAHLLLVTAFAAPLYFFPHPHLQIPHTHKHRWVRVCKCLCVSKWLVVNNEPWVTPQKNLV